MARACSVLIVLVLLGCRADDEDCRDLARHIVEVAEAEGKGGVGTVVALERDCKEQRPSRGLVECMMAAQTLAELDGC